MNIQKISPQQTIYNNNSKSKSKSASFGMIIKPESQDVIPQFLKSLEVTTEAAQKKWLGFFKQAQNVFDNFLEELVRHNLILANHTWDGGTTLKLKEIRLTAKDLNKQESEEILFATSDTKKRNTNYT